MLISVKLLAKNIIIYALGSAHEKNRLLKSERLEQARINAGQKSKFLDGLG